MNDKPWVLAGEVAFAVAEAKAAGALVVLVAWEGGSTPFQVRTIPGPSDVIAMGMLQKLHEQMSPEPDEPDDGEFEK